MSDKENKETNRQDQKKRPRAQEEETGQQKWEVVFQRYYHKKPPKKLRGKPLVKAMTLTQKRAQRAELEEVAHFFGSCVYMDPLTAMPVLVATPQEVAEAVAPAVAAAVGPAVAAAVGPAVAAAVGPAVAAAIGPAVAAAIGPAVAAAIEPMMSLERNHRLAKRNSLGIALGGAQPLHPLRKVNAGAGVALPGTAGVGALPALHPFPVGRPIPSPPFPATVVELFSLSLQQINTLAVLYNEDFEIVAEDTVVVRRQKFAAWIQGQ